MNEPITRSKTDLQRRLDEIREGNGHIPSIPGFVRLITAIARAEHHKSLWEVKSLLLDLAAQAMWWHEQIEPPPNDEEPYYQRRRAAA